MTQIYSFSQLSLRHVCTMTDLGIQIPQMANIPLWSSLPIRSCHPTSSHFEQKSFTIMVTLSLSEPPSSHNMSAARWFHLPSCSERDPMARCLCAVFWCAGIRPLVALPISAPVTAGLRECATPCRPALWLLDPTKSQCSADGLDYKSMLSHLTGEPMAAPQFVCSSLVNFPSYSPSGFF